MDNEKIIYEKIVESPSYNFTVLVSEKEIPDDDGKVWKVPFLTFHAAKVVGMGMGVASVSLLEPESAADVLKSIGDSFLEASLKVKEK